jgi:sporulation killing factor system integral membrane protein
MTDYLRLRLRQTLRTVAVSRPGRMLAFALAGLALAVGLQFFVLGEAARTPLGSVAPSGRLQAEVGYAVLLLAGMSLVTGTQSSRFPCMPADVAWVYASPIPTRHIVFAQVFWQAARRSVLWILGGVVVDVVFTIALDSDAGLFVARAVLATPLLAALVALSVGAGSTRGSNVPARVTVALGVALGAAVVVPLLVEVVTGSTARDAVEGAALSPLARSVGAILFGRYDLVAAAALAAMTVLGTALGRAGGPGLREQLTLDAAFWADFSTTSMRTTAEEPKPSFRRLATLDGPRSLLWFEVAVLRRANYQRWSLLVLLRPRSSPAASPPSSCRCSSSLPHWGS